MKPQIDWTKQLSAKDLLEPITRKNFWRRAHHHAKHVLNLASDEWPTIRPETEEWRAWMTYFHRLGWMPEVLQNMNREHEDATKAGAIGQAQFTVPTPFPEQLDPDGWTRGEAMERGWYAKRAPAQRQTEAAE